MPISTITALALFAATPGPAPVPVEHAKIELVVFTSDGQETAYMDQTPPPHGKNPRPVIEATAGEPIRARYLLTNIYPHKTIKDVVVHFYVAPIAEVGQEALPNLAAEEVVLETAFDMDFRPGGHAGARSTFRVSEPGVYLVRVETRNTQSDHEHFSAIDLVVKEPSEKNEPGSEDR